jgi:hypothetical protein
LPAPTQSYEPPTFQKDTYEPPTFQKDTYELPFFQKDAYELPLFPKDTYEIPTFQKDSYEPPTSTYKYQTGAVAGPSHPSMKLKPGRLEKAKQRAVVGESQTFTQNQPYNNFSYEPKKSMGSKMETYE